MLRFRFALDTGATRTVVNADAVARLGYDDTDMTPGATILTGSGAAQARLVRLERLTSLGLTKVGPVVFVHRLPVQARIDGLLGLDFLRESRLTIDFRAGTIELA